MEMPKRKDLMAHEPGLNVLDVFEEWDDNNEILKAEHYILNPGYICVQSALTDRGYQCVKDMMQDNAEVLEKYLLRIFEVEQRES